MYPEYMQESIKKVEASRPKRLELAKQTKEIVQPMTEAERKEVLNKLGSLPEIQPRLVYGENVAQAYQFVATGNAELGFLALSQVMKNGQLIKGSAWVVPNDLHGPIRQDGVMLARGEGNLAAESLMDYLKSAKAVAIIRAYGYRL